MVYIKVPIWKSFPSKQLHTLIKLPIYIPFIIDVISSCFFTKIFTIFSLFRLKQRNKFWLKPFKCVQQLCLTHNSHLVNQCHARVCCVCVFVFCFSPEMKCLHLHWLCHVVYTFYPLVSLVKSQRDKKKRTRVYLYDTYIVYEEKSNSHFFPTLPRDQTY